MKLFAITIYLSPEGWRKTISEIEARETAINIIVPQPAGYRKFLKPSDLMIPRSMINESHARHCVSLYAREDQIEQGKKILGQFMADRIERIMAEYNAVMGQAKNDSTKWISVEAPGMAKTPPGIKL